MNIIIRLFKELFVQFPWHFVLLFGLVLGQALTNTLSVVAIAPITDFLLGHIGENSSQVTRYFVYWISLIGIDANLLTVCIIFIGIIAVNSLTSIATQYALLRIKYDVLTHLLTDTMGRFFRARFLFFSQGDMGVLLNSFHQELNKVGDTFGHIANFFANILQVMIFLVVPYLLSPKLTVIFLVITLIISSPLWIIRKISYNLGKKNTETANTASGVLHETLTAAKLFLGFGRQENAVQRYHDAFSNHALVSVKFQTLQRGMLYIFPPLGITAAIVAMYIGYLDGVSFSDIAMILFALHRLMPIIGSVMQLKTSIEGFTPAYEQIERLRKDAIALEEPRGGAAFTGLQEGLRFKEVSFRYPGRKATLEGVSMQIRKGQMTALVGQSGAGKTTLVDLMLGLYGQSGGDILLDGKNLSQFDLNSYRQRVGYVPQDPQLFNTTVRENLLWSAPGASEQNIWNACSLANAEPFVRELPDQLETVLGDRGVRLSGGQRQRLALARAIIRKPDLLILDEATSSLDTESEGLIQKSIDKLSSEMTIIVIAHRLSTIRNVDHVYVLDKGKIIEEGSYRQLTNKVGSRLREMVMNQTI